MPQHNMTVQPRQKPPKPGQRAQERAITEAVTAQAAAAVPDAPETPDVQNGEPYPNLAEMFCGAPPEQAAIQPPVASEVRNDEPVEPSVSPTEQAAGIDPNPQQPGLVSSDQQGMVIPANTPATPRPPSTRQEFISQQRGEPAQYPDVADIFLGKVPGQIPLTGIVKVQPAPPVVREIVKEMTIVHEPPAAHLCYQFTRKAYMYIGDSYQEFQSGQRIYDTYVIDEILRGGFDGLVPVEVAENFLTCPACRHQFPSEAGRG